MFVKYLYVNDQYYNHFITFIINIDGYTKSQQITVTDN